VADRRVYPRRKKKEEEVGRLLWAHPATRAQGKWAGRQRVQRPRAGVVFPSPSLFSRLLSASSSPPMGNERGSAATESHARWQACSLVCAYEEPTPYYDLTIKFEFVESMMPLIIFKLFYLGY